MVQPKTGEGVEELASEERWERYRRMALTPEQVAGGRARLQKDIDRARAEGVYERLMEWKAGRIANAESEEPAQQEDPWARYERMKLTPKQVAEGRARLQKEIDRARAAGVYEELLKWEGKVHWDIDIDELREDRD
jgi:hypothetical protein